MFGVNVVREPVCRYGRKGGSARQGSGLLAGFLTSIAAMLVGGIGIYIVFDDTKEGS